MGTLIIHNDTEQKYSLKNGTITISGDTLILELTTSDKCFKYLIHPDTREPDVNSINNFISQKLDAAKNNNQPFILSEYLERDYIYIGNIDVEDMRQFTAQKM